MDDQTVTERDGTARVFGKNNGAVIVFAFGEFARVRDAWTRGQAFIDTTGIYGEPLTLKLAEVCAMDANSPAVMAAYEADKAIERRREQARDLTGEG